MQFRAVQKEEKGYTYDRGRRMEKKTTAGNTKERKEEDELHRH